MVEMVKAGRENWVKDESVAQCSVCMVGFGWTMRKHHCRACGNIFCWKCSNRRIDYTPWSRRGEDGYKEKPKRVCEKCFKDTQEFRSQADITKKDARTLRGDIRACVKASLDEIADLQAELQEQRGEDVELDEAIQLYRERKWQPAADAGDLCEFHKIHTFHEPLEDLHQFMYRDRTSDIIVHSWGSTKADAFAQVSMGLLQYMTDLLRRAAHEEGMATCQELEEFLFIFGHEVHVSRDVEVVLFDDDALRRSASKKGTRRAIAVGGGSNEPNVAARARTQHLIRRAGSRRQEEDQKMLSTGAAEEHAGKLWRRQTSGAEERSLGGSFCQEHTADLVVHCWGKSRANAFALLCVGVFQYMAKYDRDKGLSSRLSDTESRDLLRLLHELLNEFLHTFRIDGVQLSPHEDLVDTEACAARASARKQGDDDDDDDGPPQLVRGASQELAYVLRKRQYAIGGSRVLVPREAKTVPLPVAIKAAVSVEKMKKSLRVELDDRIQGKQCQAAESLKRDEGMKRKKRPPQSRVVTFAAA